MGHRQTNMNISFSKWRTLSTNISENVRHFGKGFPRVCLPSSRLMMDFCTDEITCLGDAVAYVLSNIKRDRQQTFLTIGFLAMALGDGIKPQLPKIMEFLRSALRPKETSASKRRSVVHIPDDAAYTCLCMLARYVQFPKSLKVFQDGE